MPAHSKRTPEMVEAILEGMSKGQTLTSLCAVHDITPKCWADWCRADEALNIAHAGAREAGFDAIADETLAIADDSSGDKTETGMNAEFVARSRLRVDTRLKLLAKWDPKRYGDRVEHTGTIRSELVQLTPDEANL